MSRYSPTVIVGIGGSGMAFVRQLQREHRKRDTDLADVEPIVYLGFDLDKSSQYELREGEEERSRSEQFYFDPAAIENTIRNLNRERVDSRGGISYDFEFIRQWFPDDADQAFRGAQVTASGARQWRALGRVGFALNAREIIANIGKAVRLLDQRRSPIPAVGDQPMIYLIGSLVGGTGSGMMHDVAANLRKQMPSYPLLAFLLLPEVFEMHSFTDNIFPNAYAALQELAHLKNQHIVFEVQYSDQLGIKTADGVILYQRIYLMGPWVGQRKPFADSESTFAIHRDMLLLSMTREMRADMISTQANAAGDAGRPLMDPASKNVFSEMTAMGIHLLSYEHLADQCLLRFADESLGTAEAAITELLSRGATAQGTALASQINELIASAADPVSRDALTGRAASRMDDFARSPIRGTPERVRSFVEDLSNEFGFGRTNSPPVVEEAVRRASAEILRRIEAEQGRHPMRNSYVAAIRTALASVPNVAQPREMPAVRDLLVLPSWISGSGLRALLLAQPTFRSQVQTARAAVLQHVQSYAETYADWVRYGVAAAARRALQESLDRETDHEGALARLCRTLADEFGLLRFQEINRDDQTQEEIYLDCRHVRPPHVVLASVLADATPAEIETFVASFSRTVGKFVRKARDVDDGPTRKSIAKEWLEATKQLFSASLATLQRYGAAGTSSYRFISPGRFVSSGQIHKAIERCITPLFQEGRVPPTTGRRTVRVLVPSSFAGWQTYRDELAALAGRTFNVPAHTVSRGREDEERIVIIVENLFRSAEEINGIYDYHAAYVLRARRDLHHVDRRWLEHLEPLVTRTRIQARVPCGNDGCDSDLRNISRAELFCPNCSRPIRNRCGNAGCLIDDLATRPNLDSIITSKVCPASDCRRKLRTYWWQCSLHGDVPIDKTSCPACVAESIPQHGTFWRPDYRGRFVCPFCTGSGKEHPHFVSGIGARWLRFGVNGHEVQPALRYFRDRLPDGRHCPTCGTILVPCCPYPTGVAGDDHFLYRERQGERGRYRCYLHITEEFQTCAICEYPVRKNDSRCNRCQTALRSCRFCTPLFGIRIPIQMKDGRCSNCHLRPDEPTTLTSLESEDPNDLFCSNIYGCPAGARMTEAVFPRGTASCPFCASESLLLLEHQTRSDHVRACAFCSRLFPTLLEGDVAAEGDWKHTEHVCCLCGQSQNSAKALVLSEQDLALTLALARALLHDIDDIVAFTRYYGSLAPADRIRIPDLLSSFSQRIENPNVAAVARERLERFAGHWERQFGCRGNAPRAAARAASQHDTRSAGQQPHPQHDRDDAIPLGLQDVSFLLAHENNVAAWVRAAKRSGLVLDRLKNLQDALEAQTDAVTARRIAALIDHAANIWDVVDEM